MSEIILKLQDIFIRQKLSRYLYHFNKNACKVTCIVNFSYKWHYLSGRRARTVLGIYSFLNYPIKNQLEDLRVFSNLSAV